MKKSKHLLALMLMTIMTFTFISCSSGSSPEESALALYNISIKGDTSDAAKLNMTEEQAKELVASVQKDVLNSSSIPTDDTELADKFLNVLLTKIKTTECRTELVSKEGDSAIVKFHIKPLNFTKVIDTALENTLKDISILQDQEKFMKEYINNLVISLETVELLSTETEIDIEFEKADTAWVPKNSMDSQKVGSSAINVDGVDEVMQKHFKQ